MYKIKKKIESLRSIFFYQFLNLFLTKTSPITKVKPPFSRDPKFESTSSSIVRDTATSCVIIDIGLRFPEGFLLSLSFQTVSSKSLVTCPKFGSSGFWGSLGLTGRS